MTAKCSESPTPLLRKSGTSPTPNWHFLSGLGKGGKGKRPHYSQLPVTHLGKSGCVNNQAHLRAADPESQRGSTYEQSP